jgi:hypothetical protein
MYAQPNEIIEVQAPPDRNGLPNHVLHLSWPCLVTVVVSFSFNRVAQTFNAKIYDTNAYVYAAITLADRAANTLLRLEMQTETPEPSLDQQRDDHSWCDHAWACGDTNYSSSAWMGGL